MWKQNLRGFCIDPPSLQYYFDEFSQVNKAEVEAMLIKHKFIKYLISSCGA